LLEINGLFSKDAAPSCMGVSAEAPSLNLPLFTQSQIFESIEFYNPRTVLLAMENGKDGEGASMEKVLHWIATG
jgi:hypothetical protein